MARSRLRGVRLPPELDAELARFCELTNRDANDVIRGVLKLFLAGGPQQAELRLTQQLWQEEPVGEGAKDVEVVALRETHPPSGGRQLVIYTPQGFQGNLEAIEDAVRAAIRSDQDKRRTGKRRAGGGR